MLLIYPPVAKPSEPPAGIAKLSAALTAHDVKHTVLDANLEALLYMVDNTRLDPHVHYDRWTTRAIRHAGRNYESLKTGRTYLNRDRYKRAVIDLDHALKQWASHGAVPGIANYRHEHYSPLRSADLIKSSECPEENPYYLYFRKRLTTLFEENDLSVVGFSLNYLSQALCTFAMAGFIKKNYPGLKIILGGGLVTSWMQGPEWNDPFSGLIDHMISGPGEEKLLSVLGVAGTCEGHMVPDYGRFHMDGYLSPGRVLPYSASTGCYWNKCSFCPEKAEKSAYEPVPADIALKDMHKIILQTKPGLVHLLDNAISVPLLKGLASDSIGVPWYGFARVSRLLTDLDFCIALKKSGCVMLKLGLESGDQGVLDRMCKGIEIETASKVLKTLKKAGIATYVYLIFGTPEETLDEARKTLSFTVKHKDEIGFLNVALFNMPVCGPGPDMFKTTSFYEGDLSLYTDFAHPSGWNRKEVRRFLDHEFKKERAVSEILQRDPPLFTSNHAPFFAVCN